jgi:tetratricopeptide (TPR) repeat protein
MPSHRTPTLCLLVALLVSTEPVVAAEPATPTLEEAVALFAGRRYAEAEQAFRALAAPGQPSATVSLHLGMLAIRRDEPATAVEHLKRAVELEPSNIRALLELGDAYGLSAQKAGALSKLGLAKRCVAAYEQAEKLAPKDLEVLQRLLGYYSQAPGIAGGGKAKALRTADRMKEIDSWAGGFAFLGLHVRDKDWAAAFAALDALAAAHPARTEVDYQRGRLAVLSGQRLDEGEAGLRRYLAQPAPAGAPAHGFAHFRLGGIHEARGQREAALLAYDEALRLDSTLRLAREARERLGGRPVAAGGD